MLNRLSSLPRTAKKAILVGVDFLLLYIALWAGFVIRLEEFWPEVLQLNWYILMWAPVLAIPAFFYFGLYNAVIRFIAPRFLFTTMKAASIATLLLFSVVAMGIVKDVPRSVYVLYWAISGGLIGGIRLVARELLPITPENGIHKTRVVVYGAGAAGTQIAKALQSSVEYEPVAFVDDKKEVQGLEILGYKVYSPYDLTTLVHKLRVEEVILSIPSASRSRRKEIIESLEPLPVIVKTLPSIPNMLSGKVQVDDIRTIDIEDLLGRDPVTPNPELLQSCITGKSVMVSGAGGSIGSELCRQILGQNPKRLVLLDISEYALYSIDQELRRMANHTELVAVLGSVLDRKRMERVLHAHDVQTIYHAAAYKHVPIIEENLTEGVRNNIFGSCHLARAALAAQVETFILISTDKAVRPTSVMGASKRFAELILQGLTLLGGPTRFTMVRFGNVLGSSGSVVPLFREQIRAGGPITVTHPEVTRYFMTIPEAAQLVIQAGAMGQGGDVFVLDMGQPVKITDLATKMILLSGLTVKQGESKMGDIPIQFTGLRPGEKLYEELLIGDNVFPTDHPRINRAEEEAMDWVEVEQFLNIFETSLQTYDAERVRETLLLAVKSYKPSGAVPDVTSKLSTDDKPRLIAASDTGKNRVFKTAAT